MTRRPLEIQLVKISEEKEYAEFVDKKGEHFENLEEFRKIIESETEKACGVNKGISSVPLRIRFYSAKVLNLLLVDLPGIVKVRVIVPRIRRATSQKTSSKWCSK